MVSWAWAAHADSVSLQMRPLASMLPAAGAITVAVIDTVLP